MASPGMFSAANYKCAVLIMIVGIVFYLVGYAAPYWVRNSAGDTGLWSCIRINDHNDWTCSFVDSDAERLQKIRALQTGGLLDMACCMLLIIFGFYYKQLCSTSMSSCSKVLGLMTFLSAAGSVASLFIFYYDTTTHNHMTSKGEYKIHYGWASYFDAVGCSLLICSGVFFIAGCQKWLEPRMTHVKKTVMEVQHARSCPYADGGSLQEPGAVLVEQLGWCADTDQP